MADRRNRLDKAPIGYKIKKGDWIVCHTSFSDMKKYFKVTDVNGTRAFAKAKGRNDLKFPRYYSIPFLPLQKKTKPNYVSPNTWYVLMEDSIKHLRFRKLD